MLAFEVEIDGEHIVLAGVEDWSILALHVNASRGDPTSPRESAREDEVMFSVGGLTERDSSGIAHHFRWGGRDLKVGSKVTVTIVETESPDAPVKRYRSDSQAQENPFTEEELKEMRRQDYLELKKEFGE